MNLTEIPGNDKCADCRQPGPQYASHNLGILLCETCASIHRSLGPQISKIKSLKMDNWDEAMLKSVSDFGNIKVNATYEANVPPCYRRPQPDDPHVLREQWIRAKYDRKEFLIDAKKPPYLSGNKDGYLWKRGKDDRHFQRRRFVLDSTENTLKYFNKEEARDPKATLRLDGINLMIVPEKVGNPNAMQITFEQGEQTRNLFIYSDDGQELIEWYTAIRCAKLNRLQIAYPGADTSELAKTVTWEYIREGWLSKTGPKSGDAFRRRWVTLDKRKLMYFEDPLDPFPKGEVYFGSRGFEVVKGMSTNGGKVTGFSFVLKTPERSFHFMAENEAEQEKWIEAINQVIVGAKPS